MTSCGVAITYSTAAEHWGHAFYSYIWRRRIIATSGASRFKTRGGVELELESSQRDFDVRRGKMLTSRVQHSVLFLSPLFSLHNFQEGSTSNHEIFLIISSALVLYFRGFGIESYVKRPSPFCASLLSPRKKERAQNGLWTFYLRLNSETSEI